MNNANASREYILLSKHIVWISSCSVFTLHFTFTLLLPIWRPFLHNRILICESAEGCRMNYFKFFFTSKYQLRKRCFFCTSLFSNPRDWAILHNVSQRPEWDFVIVGKKYKQYILHCYHWSNVKVLLERGHSHAHNCFCSQLYSKSLL